MVKSNNIYIPLGVIRMQARLREMHKRDYQLNYECLNARPLESEWSCLLRDLKSFGERVSEQTRRERYSFRLVK